jgi:hypothetical protein
MLAAITCHFNPIEYDNIVRNYWKFRENLKGTDLFSIELSFNGKFEIEDAIHVEGKPEHIMWQKERLLNLLIEQLPEKYDKIAWLDGDILFDNDDWAQEAEKALDGFPLVQLYERAEETDSDLNVTKSVPGIVYAGVESHNAKPGYAWAARREVLPLLDTHIMGGGDTMMYYAAMGLFTAPFYRKIKANIGFVSGDIRHLYHGTYADRQYVERWMILKHNRFNPDIDIAINDAGIWEWSSDKPELHESVAEYFEERKEDEEWIASM